MVIHRVSLIVGSVSKPNDYHGLMLLSVTLSRLSAHYKLSLMVGSVQEECSLSSQSQAYRVCLSIQGCMRKERPNSMILSFLLFSHFCLLIYSFLPCILLMDYNLSPGFYCSYEGFSLPCLVPHICGYGWVPEAPTLLLLLSCSYYVTKAFGFCVIFCIFLKKVDKFDF